MQTSIFNHARAWVKRLKYKKSQLTIDVTDKKRSRSLVFLLELSSKRECKQLWKQLIEQHAFFEREISNPTGSNLPFRKHKGPARNDVAQSLFQRVPSSLIDRTRTNTFVQRHSSFEVFQHKPSNCATPDYSLDDQRHFGHFNGNLSSSSIQTGERHLDKTEQVSVILTDHSDDGLGTPGLLPIMESSSYSNIINAHGGKVTSGSASTLPSPSLKPILSVKSRAALARTHSHTGHRPVGQEDTLSLSEYQKKATQNNWHRSKHQQQLEKLLDEYERYSSQSASSGSSLTHHRRSMSHEALYNSKLRLKTSIKQSLFPWKKPRHSLSLSGGLASISSRERGTRFNGTVSNGDSRGSLEGENRSRKWLSTEDIFEDDSVFTEADNQSSSVPGDSLLNDCIGDLSTRRCSSGESSRHTNNQILSLDDLT